MPLLKSLLSVCAFVLLPLCVASAKYQHTLKLHQYEENVSEAQILHDDSISISKNQEVRSFSTQMTKETQKDKLDARKIKVTKEGIATLSKDGLTIKFTSFANQNITFLQKNLQSNLLITPKYALVGQNNQDQPILKKLNFETLKLSTITYPRVDNWSSLYPAILADFNNGDLAYSQGLHMFLLDNQTLQIKQTIVGERIVDDVRFISTYYNPKTNISNYLVGRSGNSIIVSELKKNPQTQQYESQYRFNTFDASSYSFEITLTGTNSGVTFDKFMSCSITYWENLHSILDLTFDKKYYMKNKQKITVSQNEEFFVVRNDSGFYEFYTMKENYQVSHIKSIFIDYNDFRKAKTTTDNKYLFVSMSNTRDKHNIVQVDISEGQFDLITEKDGSSDNLLDFSLFDSKYNRFITLSLRNSKNYYLQLRSLQDLSIVSQIQLSLNFTVLEYKLVGNFQWGLTFGLAARNKPYAYDLEIDSKIMLFKVEDDKIINANISRDVSFNFLQSCHRYLVSYKARFNPIKIIHFQNLTLAFTIDPQTQYPVQIMIEKNILMINPFGIYLVYDLTKANSGLGSLYYNDNIYLSSPMSLIFPKRGILYQASTSAWPSPSNVITKQISNISSPPMKSSLTIKDQGCYYPTYLIAEETQQLFHNQCNFIFYIEYLRVDQSVYTKMPQIVRYSECTKKSDKYPVVQYTDEDLSSIIFISTDKRYISILVKPWQKDQLLLQIRLINSLQKIVYHKVFGYYPQRYNYLHQFHVQVVNDKLVIIQSPQFLTVSFIQPTQYAFSHSITQISSFDIKDRILAFVGPSIHSNQYTIIIKHLNDQKNLFKSHIKSAVKGIALSSSASTIAAFTEEGVLVWRTSSSQIVLQKQLRNITGINIIFDKFIQIASNENYYLLKMSGGEWLQITSPVAQNEDLRLFAYTINKSEIIFCNQEGDIFNKISAGEKQDVSFIEFSKDGSLYAITKENKSKVWKPSGSHLLSNQQ